MENDLKSKIMEKVAQKGEVLRKAVPSFLLLWCFVYYVITFKYFFCTSVQMLFCLNTLYTFNSIYFSNMHQHWPAVLACIMHCWSSNRCTIQCLPLRVLFQMDIKTKRSWLKYVIFLFLCDHSLSLSFSLSFSFSMREEEKIEKNSLLDW